MEYLFARTYLEFIFKIERDEILQGFKFQIDTRKTCVSVLNEREQGNL